MNAMLQRVIHFVPRRGSRYLTGILRGAGLERRGRVEEFRQALQKSERRVVDLRRLLEQSRADAASYKTKSRERIERAEARLLAQEEKGRACIETIEQHYRSELDTLKKVEEQRVEEMRALRDKVAELPRLKEADDRRLEKMRERLLEQRRSAAASYKKKCRERLEQAVARLQVQEEKRRVRIEAIEQRYRSELDRLKKVEEQRVERMRELRDKVAQAEHSWRIGREHLMSVETKLDLVEGAINTLDRRFRTAAVQISQNGGDQSRGESR